MVLKSPIATAKPEVKARTSLPCPGRFHEMKQDDLEKSVPVKMRRSVVIPVILLAAAALLAIYFARSDRGQSRAAFPPAETVASPMAATPAAAANRTAVRHRTEGKAATQTDNSIDQETQAEFVSKRVAELMDLAMTDDTNSLDSILAELNNNNAEIREAAVTAAVQFKSPEAIPALKDAYARTDDPEDKIRIAKAIEFLAVPREAQSTAQAN